MYNRLLRNRPDHRKARPEVDSDPRVPVGRSLPGHHGGQVQRAEHGGLRRVFRVLTVLLQLWRECVSLFSPLSSIEQCTKWRSTYSTTYVYPAEVFPTRYRASAHGISAACGKAGAIISALGFNSLTDSIGTPAVLYSAFLLSFFLFPPSRVGSCMCTRSLIGLVLVFQSA